MARLISTPVNENNTSDNINTYSQPQHQLGTTNSYRVNARLDNINIDSNPLLKSLHDQVDSMLQQSSGQDVMKIFFTVLSAIDKNLSNPNSPLSMNSDANDLRRLFSFPTNGRMNLTLSLLRPSQQSTTSSSSSHEEEIEEKDDDELNLNGFSSDSHLLPPPPETWSDSDMTYLIDQVDEDEEIEKINNTLPFYSAYGAYR
ncbi:hypothetical protein C1645_772152 [Glomus cerebriforme]|uniref:Uncharacterized protein n=1 Tax=Glomus cerebriforme TaxID=658196 RepID=A0A397T2X5_9GLOM|nr:hypothetical protein C1645_772152 [Glomus cerebriforme]